MKISRSLIDALRQLCRGEALAASKLRNDVAETLLAEGQLTVSAHGSRRSYRAINAAALRNFLASHYEAFRNLDAMADALTDANRAALAAPGGNSKLLSVRSCPGFPVNSYEEIVCTLRGKALAVGPAEGTFLFVADWREFAVPEDVVVVGIENMENFRLVGRQRPFFERYFADQGRRQTPRLLFVARYPQSTDLRRWLESIPNEYLHFGDFDLAGIQIFLTDFHRYLPARATFLIPSDIEQRLASGSVSRYNDQFLHHRNVAAPACPQLQRLIDLINRLHRAYDQEGYIPPP